MCKHFDQNALINIKTIEWQQKKIENRVENKVIIVWLRKRQLVRYEPSV